MAGRRFVAALVVLGALAGPSAWAVPTSFSVTGQVATPGVYDAAALQALMAGVAGLCALRQRRSAGAIG